MVRDSLHHAVAPSLRHPPASLRFLPQTWASCSDYRHQDGGSCSAILGLQSHQKC